MPGRGRQDAWEHRLDTRHMTSTDVCVASCWHAVVSINLGADRVGQFWHYVHVCAAAAAASHTMRFAEVVVEVLLECPRSACSLEHCCLTA